MLYVFCEKRMDLSAYKIQIPRIPEKKKIMTVSILPGCLENKVLGLGK